MKTTRVYLLILGLLLMGSGAFAKDRVNLQCMSPGGALLKWQIVLDGTTVRALRGETVDTAFDVTLPRKSSQGSLNLSAKMKTQKISFNTGHTGGQLFFQVSEKGSEDVIQIRGKLKGEKIRLSCHFRRGF